MDGRNNIPVATNTPPGIIQPFRNLGGMFDMGWPHLGEVLAQIGREFPDLAGKMIRYTAVLDWNSRRIEALPENCIRRFLATGE